MYYRISKKFSFKNIRIATKTIFLIVMRRYRRHWTKNKVEMKVWSTITNFIIINKTELKENLFNLPYFLKAVEIYF